MSMSYNTTIPVLQESESEEGEGFVNGTQMSPIVIDDSDTGSSSGDDEDEEEEEEEEEFAIRVDVSDQEEVCVCVCVHVILNGMCV